MLHLIKLMNRFQMREDGQSLAEYALILALIAVAAIVALGALGTNISSILTKISGNLAG
jgi:pilus assembly protein Flp/PilA